MSSSSRAYISSNNQRSPLKRKSSLFFEIFNPAFIKLFFHSVKDALFAYRITQNDYLLYKKRIPDCFVPRNDDARRPSSYFIQALGKRGGIQMGLIMDRESFPKLIHAPQTPVMEIAKSTAIEGTDHYPSSRTDTFLAKAERRSQYDEAMRVIQLGEVEATARRIE